MDSDKLTIAVSTWNVGAAAGAQATTSAAGVDAWLRAGQPSTADVHVVALQEVVDIKSPLSYVFNPLSMHHKTLSSEAVLWADELHKVMPSHVVVAKAELVGMVIFVLISAQHAAGCRSARVAHMGMGPLGAGNKGAVAASLSLYERSVCFICAHFASGTKHLDARNKQMRTLLSDLHFPNDAEEGSTSSLPESPGAHDVVIWCGDLNYRIAKRDADTRARAWRPAPAAALFPWACARAHARPLNI